MGVERRILLAENEVKLQLEGREAGREDFSESSGQTQKGGRKCEERERDVITQNRKRFLFNSF